MKKTILLVVALILIFSLCRTGDSYAVSDKKLAKLARKAEEAITEAQASLTQWETAGYPAPKAEEILEKARQTYEAGDYKEACKLAEESLAVSSDKGLKKKAQKAKEAIAEAKARITRCESDGYPVPEATGILEKARQANKRGNYEEACKLAKESFKVSSKKLRKYAKIDAKDAGKLIKKAEKGMIKWESVFQISSPKARESLEKARLAYQAGDYGKAYKLAYQSLGLLKQAAWAEKYIRKAEAYITKWEHAGYDAPQKRRLLAAACEAQRMGEHQKAYQLASDAVGLLRREARGEPLEPEVEFHLKPGVNLGVYQKLVVLEFKDEPRTPGSGRKVTNLISEAFLKKGYQIVSNKEETDAVVTGTLMKYGTYETRYEAYSILGYREGTVPTLEVQLELQMKDARTDSTIWIGRSKREVALELPVIPGVFNVVSDQDPKVVLESMAQAIIDSILDKIPPGSYQGGE